MRFVQFNYKGSQNPRVGVQLEGENGNIVDLVSFPSNMVDFIKGGKELTDKLDSKDASFTMVEMLRNGIPPKSKMESVIKSGKFIVPFSEVTLMAPVTSPDKVICIGMNYKDHCEEQGAPIPTEPVVFNKFPSTIIAPNEDIPYPECTKELDWEVEMAIVIGKKGKNISRSDAMDHVFGYTVSHDVSARDWQLKRNGGQWLIGKTMDGFCPLGPAIVTTDELGDPHNLKLSCSVNGVTKQDSSTNQLIFKTEEIVEWISKFCTLLPGDVILTGTPPGVGVFMKPPQFLKKGDVVECKIEGIGSISNKIV